MNDDLKKRLIDALESSREYAYEAKGGMLGLEDVPRYKYRIDTYNADIEKFDALIKELVSLKN